jgi:hypothetical protein
LIGNVPQSRTDQSFASKKMLRRYIGWKSFEFELYTVYAARERPNGVLYKTKVEAEEHDH